MKKRGIRGSLIAAATASLLALTSCGGGDDAPTETDQEATQSGGELTEISVGVIPIVDVAPIYLGVQEGIFEEHGLDVELTLAQGGAAIIPAIQSGDFDFGFSNITSLVIGKSQGLPLQLVAPGPQTTGEAGNDFSSLLVPEDSDVESIADLEGKRVAVNTLNNINDTVLKEGMRQAGGDRDSMDLVEVAFPDMGAQLESGNVDAIMAVEPFATLAKNAGAKEIYSPYAEPIEDLMIAGYFTNTDKIESDPELVDSFVAAVKESQQYAEDNPDAAKEILSEYTEIEPEVVEQLHMPRFPQEVNRESTERIIELSDETGLINETVDINDLIYESN
ncbi:ABC transporter substrate-binding protein [Enteractinococcus coprophilus]|uniref:NitT/TauT family transport system substrate-binding protein n=1 Tax=Enteractinococcus coprophilus TaxID=1027633 RepID=A0A543AN33_9MICC|nr:ABC transporter substrate-binding protein [Enteractinococcus coprophilus]TQL73994.1 NitT/TauT family transport system substrate-binding protein [Enteractinococcus coprophilus]